LDSIDSNTCFIYLIENHSKKLYEKEKIIWIIKVKIKEITHFEGGELIHEEEAMEEEVILQHIDIKYFMKNNREQMRHTPHHFCILRLNILVSFPVLETIPMVSLSTKQGLVVSIPHFLRLI
jgi:hypothetical protein